MEKKRKRNFSFLNGVKNNALFLEHFTATCKFKRVTQYVRKLFF